MPGWLFSSVQVASYSVVVLLALASANVCQSAERTLSRDLLSEDQWQRLEESVDNGLKFLASRQQPDGSFLAPVTGQPGITSLCVLAFLSRGHLPGEGTYGQAMDRAIDFVLRAQQDDGLIFDMPVENRAWPDDRHKAAAYNHAISGVMLGEVYGMTRTATSDRIGDAIRKALRFTREMQLRPKPNEDKGGWRYLVTDPGTNQSDLSVTSWQIMFLRSARNAEFDVPLSYIEPSTDYVRRAYVREKGTFSYGHRNLRGQDTRAMTGSGILLLSLGGEHDTEIARKAGKWLLDHPFDRYNRVIHGAERYHYSAYYCSQAMFQLGGTYWEKFFPAFMAVQISGQRADGSWAEESNRDGRFGNVYTSALTILSLTPAYQLLPIYQR